MSRAETYLRLVEGLEAERSPWESLWSTLEERIMPRRVDNYIPDMKMAKWHSSEASYACSLLAAGHTTYITPINQRWFSFKPSLKDASDAVTKWYGECTEIALEALSESNFYTSIHEMYIDRCLYGPGCVLCEWDEKKGGLNFRHIKTGAFSVAENYRGYVDTLARTFKMSAQQAMEQFGEENLGEKLRAILQDYRKRYEPVHEFAHLVKPNENFVPGSFKASEREFLSIYLYKDQKIVVEEDGFYEFPYLYTRFLKWGSGPYAVAPGYFVDPEICRTIFLDEMQDTLAEVAAFPRLLMLANQVGEVDLRAGGRTIVEQQAAQMNLPREWATAGNYEIPADRMQSKEEKIRRAFHTDMLQVISSVDKEMTATEVQARESEKVLSFSPSYTQMVTDLSPFGERIFALLFRARKFPDPPEEVVRDGFVRPPKLAFQNKISTALDRLKSEGLINAAGVIAQFAQMEPFAEAADIIKPREAAKEIYRSAGAPESALKSDEELELEDEAKRQALAQQQALMEQQAEAATAKDAAGAAKSMNDAGLL